MAHPAKNGFVKGEEMDTRSRPVVTKVEALHLLGVKAASLAFLEKAARVPEKPGRNGYTVTELNRLFAAIRTAFKSDE